MPEYYGLENFNTGDDVAGVVESVGDGITEFKPGDRVAGMHRSGTPHGSYAEYAICPVDTTFHIPDNITFEEASTIPLAALTAGVLLFRGLELPDLRDSDPTEKLPFLVYGGASAIGAFAIQLASHRGIHPIIAVAGRGIPFVEGLIDKTKGDTVIDYRSGDEAVTNAIRGALNGMKLRYALDAVRSGTSYINAARVLEPGSAGGQMSKLGLVLPLSGDATSTAGLEAGMVEQFTLPDGVKEVFLGVNQVHDPKSDRDMEFGFLFCRLLARGLREGWLKPHPHQVQAHGLCGVEGALTKLKAGQASAQKYVVRISDTPGI